MDTVAIYDTQQAGPVCFLTKLHYDEFTDVTWSADGQCLILSSRDGYCTLIIFDDILPAHHIQQHALQLQSIAHNHSTPLSYSISGSSSSNVPTSRSGTPAATPSSSNAGLPFVVTPTVPKKRSDPPLTPAASVDGGELPSAYVASSSAQSQGEASPEKANENNASQQPPKKKRRVALTRVGDLDS